MADRRPTNGLNPRSREPIGRERDDVQRGNRALALLRESGDFSPETIERIAELLGQLTREVDRLRR